MRPADQRFSTNDCCAIVAIACLIVQAELLVLNSQAQFLFGLLAVLYVLSHGFGEDVVLVSPFSLGAIHRDVCMLQQRLCAVSIVRVDADADTRCHPQRCIIDNEWIGQLVNDGICQFHQWCVVAHRFKQN